MIKRQTLSVVLATYNEENNIKKCLQSVKDLADEVIVVDGSSEDNTLEIARKIGARVIKTTNKPMFHTNKQMAIDEAKCDWVLQLDADEIISDMLKKEISEILTKGSDFSAFYIPRKNYFLGKWLKKGGQYPDPVIRLFKRGKAYLPQQSVHEQLEVKGKVGKLEGHLNHYTAPNFSRYITNANRYTSLTADKLTNQGLGTGILESLNYIIFKPAWTFFLLYFRHKGFFDGYQGFVFALFSALHWPIAFMKHWENLRLKQ